VKIDDYKEIVVNQTFDGVRLLVSVYDYLDDFSPKSLNTSISVRLTPSQARQIARDLLNAASPMFKTNDQGGIDSNVG